MVRREGIENTSLVTQLVDNLVDDNAGVRIVRRGTLAENGLPFVLVSSSSEPGRVHCVAYAYEDVYVGARIHCDCAAASYGRGCSHVRLVMAWLAELMASTPLSGAGSSSPPAASAPVESTAAIEMLEPDARETMLNRTRSFQMMK